jgi:hypothetical protein
VAYLKKNDKKAKGRREPDPIEKPANKKHKESTEKKSKEGDQYADQKNKRTSLRIA